MPQDRITQAIRKALHQMVFIYLKRLLLVLLGAYLLSGVYKIDNDAVGVVTRFGTLLQPAVPPGLHYKLPWPVDAVRQVAVKQVKTLRLSDFYRQEAKPVSESRGNAFFFETEIDPYCITGDNNIVSVNLLIKYTVEDPVKYLFANKKSDNLMERTAASVVLHNLAGRRIDDILTSGKKQIESEMLSTLRSRLEALHTGISITFLELEQIRPPHAVESAFHQVINAKVNKKQMYNEAQGYYNRLVPKARSSADKIVQDAMAYKHERVSKAQGEASRFRSRLEGYRQDPVTVRRNIFLTFVRSIYPKLKEIRVVAPNGSSQSFPLLFPTSAANSQ
jgi:membrane protease subunit HflK